MIPIKDSIPSRTDPWVCHTIIFINVIVFLNETGLNPNQLNILIHNWGLIPVLHTHSDLVHIGRLPQQPVTVFISHIFLHGEWIHLIGNMLALWIFGDNVEDRMGHGRFLAFYLLCGITAAMTHVFLNPDSVVPTVGASGAIAGVMGAYFISFPSARLILLTPIFFYPLFVEVPAVLGPVDPQLGQFPAASILKVIEQKHLDEIDDETLIRADLAKKAISQVEETVNELLKDKMTEERARKIARISYSHSREN